MSLYRRKNPKSGRLSPVWWTRFSVEGRKFRKSTGLTDKRAAGAREAEMIRTEQRKAAGLTDHFDEHSTRPLAQHVLDFESALRSRRVSDGHFTDRMKCLRRFVTDTRLTSLDQLDGALAARWLSDIGNQGLRARSVNRHYQALRQFGRWLHRHQRVRRDPFTALKPRNEAEDRARERRALAPEELARLIQAAAARPLDYALKTRIHKGVTGKERVRLTKEGSRRSFLYGFAALTGIRRKELGSITWADVDLERETIRIRAANAKSRREQYASFPSCLAPALRQRSAEVNNPDAKVFPSGWIPVMRTMRKDLEAAGIAYQDMQGRYVDFHSLRCTFVTGLRAAKVDPQVTQHLARHANIETTMSVYTDPRLLDHRSAVNAPESVHVIGEMLASGDAADCAPICTPSGAISVHSVSSGCNQVDRRNAEGDRRETRNEPDETLVCCGIESGGGKGIRTLDPWLAKPVL